MLVFHPASFARDEKLRQSKDRYGAVALLEMTSRLRDQRFTLTGCTLRNPKGMGRASILLARLGSPGRAVRSAKAS